SLSCWISPSLAIRPFPYTTLFRSVYVIIPIAGVFIAFFAVVDLIAVATGREPAYPEIDEGEEPIHMEQLAGHDPAHPDAISPERSEEHTSELQSRFELVCRLLLEK